MTLPGEEKYDDDFDCDDEVIDAIARVARKILTERAPEINDAIRKYTRETIESDKFKAAFRELPDRRANYLLDRLDEYLNSDVSPLEAWELALLDYRSYTGVTKNVPSTGGNSNERITQ